MNLFKKFLTSEAATRGPSAVACETGPAKATTPILTSSADKPVSHVASAVIFVRMLIKWCDSVGVRGDMDWPRLYNLALEYADSEGMRVPSRMALAKALAQLNIPKTTRLIEPHERGTVSARRSNAERPRVTVYHLTSDAVASVAADDPQIDMFL